jgi:hypothetical protein
MTRRAVYPIYSLAINMFIGFTPGIRADREFGVRAAKVSNPSDLS